jgi:hypothetical protein
MAIGRDGDIMALADSICKAFVEGLDMDGAALTLLTATVAGNTLEATDPVAELLEELQFSLNEGASIEAAGTGRPVLAADLIGGEEATHWPVFAAAATEQSPARALFALPLQWGAVQLGVLAVYRRRPGGLTDEQRADALAAAEVAALMMLTLRTDPAGIADGDGWAEPLQPWLEPMVAHRAEVHQATGMILAQLGVDAEVALARMRAHAFAEQRLLVDVAHDVVARTLVFTEVLNDGPDTEEVP